MTPETAGAQPQGLVAQALALVDRSPRLLIGAVMLFSSLAVYVPFLGSLDKVCRYWDGPLYMYVAKTLYRVPEDHPFAAYDLPRTYFANQLPAYPLLIRALTPLALGSYPAAMLLATLLTSVVAAVLFFEVLKAFDLVASPVWTAVLFCFLPPRWVLYHAVGASEPLFHCCVFAAFLALKAERPWRVAAFIGLASLTRIVGVLLVPIFALIYVQRGQWRRAAAMPVALLGMLGLFAYYHVVYHDFFAYFTSSIGYPQRVSPWPFEIFRRYASSDKLHSVELFAWMYIVYGIGSLALWKHRELFTFSVFYFIFYTLTTNQDLPRYILTIAPFAILVAFDPLLSRPACRLALPMVVYLDYAYAWRFLPSKLVSSAVYERLLAALGSGS